MDPLFSSRSLRRHAVGCLFTLAALAGPAMAGTVFFTDGRGLTVEDAWMEDGLIHARLPGGGVIGLSTDRVARVHLPPPAPPEPAEAATSLETLARHVARRYEVDEELVAAVVRAESGFDPDAVSRVGAMGLMQLMPATARQYGVAAADLFDVEKNLETGMRHFLGLLRRYGEDTRLALAAYNAGEGAVQRYGGIPPYRETQNYVRKIMGFWYGS